ncbi:pilus assembly protein [Motiliproteus sp. SC1-56]|uniref:pilus assembly protein n=1 Tax=Motiliproteus sp. SC1-56 TaxID=2799565 RepID=UPI001A8E2342|nr:PilC/PilY family type IV pilus protein [Motiliproteus sp. SC1-56]
MKRKVAVAWISVLGSSPAWAADLSNFPPTDSPYGWIAPVAVSQQDISDGNAKLYRGWFDNVTQAGDLVRHSISTSGAVSSTPDWKAAALLDARTYSNRMVIKGSDTSYNLCASGDALEAFLCGDNSNEVSTGGSGAYRDRTSDLGTLIHSNPVHVAAPRFAYPFDNYLGFRKTWLNRSERIYVGANDGMLHAFDGSGNEIFGYLPGTTYAKTASWATDTSGAHRYLLDGPLVTGDAYADFDGSGNEWATLLVGGLGAGGTGYFALDVTTPVVSGASVSTVADTKLWEWGPDGIGIGHTYGAPLIARTNADGKWALIAGNGYAQGGEPILYVREIQAPQTVIQDFNSLESPAVAPSGNGLSGPAAIDVDGDFKVDYAYAGDLNGNLWRFDLSKTAPSGWSATKIFTATDGTVAQPILATPELALLPDNKVMVYFGTGDPWNISSTTQHSLYALKDSFGSDTYSRDDLQARSLASTTNADYLTMDETASPNDQAVDWSSQHGWYVDLSTDQHLLQTPVLDDSRIQFVAHDLNAGNNWLIHLEYTDGRLPEKVIFDINGDETLTPAGDNIDYVDASDEGDRVVGLRVKANLVSGQRLALNDQGAALSYFNTWHAGTAGSEGSKVTTYGPAKCSTMTFSRLRVLNDDIDVTFDYTAHTLGGDFTASITVDPEEKDDNARSPGLDNYPTTAGADSGILTGTDTVQKWFGLELEVLADTVGSNDTQLVVTYHGPYRSNGFTLASSSNMYRIDDEGGFAIKTCEYPAGDYATKSCTGKPTCTQQKSRFDYENAKASVTFTGQTWSDLNASLEYDPTDTKEVEAIPSTPASGSSSGQLQNGADNQTGRLRWRELLF